MHNFFDNISLLIFNRTTGNSKYGLITKDIIYKTNTTKKKKPRTSMIYKALIFIKVAQLEPEKNLNYDLTISVLQINYFIGFNSFLYQNFT